MKCEDQLSEIRERSRTPERPYCWQSKEARRLIRERMNGEGSVASLLSIYDALTEVASNEMKETFQAGQPYIGTLAGVDARTVRRLEPVLEEIGVVKIIKPRLRGHHTYKLLSFRHNVPTLGQSEERDSCPPVEEQRSNEGKTSEIIHGTGVPGGSFILGFENLDDHEMEFVTYYNSTLPGKMKGWLPVTEVTPSLKGALNRVAIETGVLDLAFDTVNAVVNAPESIQLPKKMSLARLLFENPNGPYG